MYMITIGGRSLRSILRTKAVSRRCLSSGDRSLTRGGGSLFVLVVVASSRYVSEMWSAVLLISSLERSTPVAAISGCSGATCSFLYIYTERDEGRQRQLNSSTARPTSFKTIRRQKRRHDGIAHVLCLTIITILSSFYTRLTSQKRKNSGTICGEAPLGHCGERLTLTPVTIAQRSIPLDGKYFVGHQSSAFTRCLFMIERRTSDITFVSGVVI